MSHCAHLVERRRRSCAYLKEVYGGSKHWLSVVTLGAASSAKDDGLEEAQVLRWFYLGVSLATLLPQPPGAPFVRAILQLLEELQYHFSSSTERNIKSIRARGPNRAGSGTLAAGDDSDLA